MIETSLRECACGATYLAAQDEPMCALCEKSARPAYLSAPRYTPTRLFYAPETLCGQQTLPGALS